MIAHQLAGWFVQQGVLGDYRLDWFAASSTVHGLLNSTLRDEFADDFAVNVGQAEVSACVTIRQLRVIEAE